TAMGAGPAHDDRRAAYSSELAFNTASYAIHHRAPRASHTMVRPLAASVTGAGACPSIDTGSARSRGAEYASSTVEYPAGIRPRATSWYPTPVERNNARHANALPGLHTTDAA